MMSSVVIDISELRNAYSDEVGELEKFLKERIKAKIDVGDREITLQPGDKGEAPSRGYLRVLLKKYLHRAELKEEFRVIAGKENMLIIKERKTAAETE
jgi:hypothetical protein